MKNSKLNSDFTSLIFNVQNTMPIEDRFNRLKILAHIRTYLEDKFDYRADEKLEQIIGDEYDMTTGDELKLIDLYMLKYAADQSHTDNDTRMLHLKNHPELAATLHQPEVGWISDNKECMPNKLLLSTGMDNHNNKIVIDHRPIKVNEICSKIRLLDGETLKQLVGTHSVDNKQERTGDEKRYM